VKRGLVTVVLLPASLSLGCIERNAYLELTVTFPKDESTTQAARYGVVRVNTGDVSFDADWESSEVVPPVRLSRTQSTKQQISVEGREEIETQPVRVKVRFCRDPNCVGINDDHAPEVRYEIERAFYLGKRTSLSLSVDCIPNVPTEMDPMCAIMDQSVVTVSKCSVAGCREGVTSNYCTGNVHFCEQ